MAPLAMRAREGRRESPHELRRAVGALIFGCICAVAVMQLDETRYLHEDLEASQMMGRALDNAKPPHLQRNRAVGIPSVRHSEENAAAGTYSLFTLGDREAHSSDILKSAHFDGKDPKEKKIAMNWAERAKRLRLVHHFDYQKDMAKKRHKNEQVILQGVTTKTSAPIKVGAAKVVSSRPTRTLMTKVATAPDLETTKQNSGLSMMELMRKAARLNEIAIMHANVEMQAAMVNEESTVMEAVSHDDLKLRASLPIPAKHPLPKNAMPKVVKPPVVKKKHSTKELSGDDALKAMENPEVEDNADSDASMAKIDAEADKEEKKSSSFIDKLLKHPHQATEEHDFASNGESIQDFLSAEAKAIKKREGIKHFPSVHKILTKEVAIESVPAIVKMVSPVSPVAAIGTDAVIDEQARSDAQKNRFVVTSTDEGKATASKQFKVNNDVMDQALSEDEQATASSVPPDHSNTAALLHPFRTKTSVKPVASVALPEGMNDPLSEQIKAAHEDEAQAANMRAESQTDDQNTLDRIMRGTGASDYDY